MVCSAAVVINISNISLNLTQRQIKSIEFGTITRDTSCLPNFGVIEQNASVTFYDKDFKIYEELMKGNDLDGGFSIYESNGAAHVYYLSDVSIDDTETQVTLTGVDSTKILQDIIVPKSSIMDRTVDDLLVEFFRYLPEDYKWSYYDKVTEQNAKHISIPNCWYREGNLRDFLEKICEVALLNIFFEDGIFYIMRGVL